MRVPIVVVAPRRDPALALAAAFLKHDIELSKVRDTRKRHHEGSPGKAHHPLDLTLVIALAGTAIAAFEHIMRFQGGKQGAALAAAITKDLRHRQPGVVVEHRHRYAAEEGECRYMALTEGPGCLGRVGLHVDRIAVGQRHHEEVHLPGHAADYRPGLAKIRLGMTRWVRQRHERLLQAKPARMDIIPHRRIAAVKATLVAQAIVTPLDRVTLLLRRAQIITQDQRL